MKRHNKKTKFSYLDDDYAIVGKIVHVRLPMTGDQDTKHVTLMDLDDWERLRNDRARSCKIVKNSNATPRRDKSKHTIYLRVHTAEYTPGVRQRNGRYWKNIIDLARLILGSPEKMHVDHINGDTLDNRRVNLRIATVRQNIMNRTRVDVRNKTGVAGVYPSTRYPGKFMCHISMLSPEGKRQQRHFGPFDTINEAADVRRGLELKHYGEFAPLRQLRRASTQEMGGTMAITHGGPPTTSEGPPTPSAGPSTMTGASPGPGESAGTS